MPARRAGPGRRRSEDQHGWTGPVDGLRHDRTVVAQREIRPESTCTPTTTARKPAQGSVPTSTTTTPGAAIKAWQDSPDEGYHGRRQQPSLCV